MQHTLLTNGHGMQRITSLAHVFEGQCAGDSDNDCMSPAIIPYQLQWQLIIITQPIWLRNGHRMKRITSIAHVWAGTMCWQQWQWLYVTNNSPIPATVTMIITQPAWLRQRARDATNHIHSTYMSWNNVLAIVTMTVYHQQSSHISYSDRSSSNQHGSEMGTGCNETSIAPIWAGRKCWQHWQWM